jgi:hypothetical protein
MKSKSSLLGSVVPELTLLLACVAIAGCASNSLPLPTITSISPTSVPAGGTGFTLKVMGTGFLNTDVVEWNGQILATVPVSSTELDAEVPASLIPGAAKAKAGFRLANWRQARAQLTPEQAGDVTVDITVLQKPPASVVSNTFTFTIMTGPPPPDFSLSASPSSQTVTAGGSTTYGVTIGALNGFTGVVNLTVSGLSTAVTGNFLPLSVTGSGGSTLTVSTSTTTPAGTSTLTITGTSGTLTHSTTVTLIVNAAPSPDFSISASPSSQTVTAGNSTTYSVTIGALNGFTGTVNLKVSGLPTGATGSFTPSSVTGSGTSSIGVSTSSSTPTGTSTLTITGTSGSLLHTTTVTLVVNAAATQDFSISATPSSQTVTSGGTTTYNVTITAMNGFTGTVTLGTNSLPSGATGSFNPTTVTGSGTSVLTIGTGATMPAPGPYTFMITGTSGSLMHSTGVVLTITAASSGGLFISTVFVPTSAPGFTNVNVIVKFGNNGSTPIGGVSVAITGLPSAVTPVAIVLLGASGSCTITNFTCTLSGTLPAGSDPIVMLTFQAVPGTANITGTATVSATGATSANANFTTSTIDCTPGPGVLCGQYVIYLQGYVPSVGPTMFAGTFLADGAGNVNQGTLDYISPTSVSSDLTIGTGSSYSFDANGLGNLTLVNPGGYTFVFKFALDPTVGTSGSVIEYEPSGATMAPNDGIESASGFLQLQAPAYFVDQIVGNYGFAAIGGLGFATGAAGVRVGMLGAVTADGNCGFSPTGATGTINNGGTKSSAVSFSGSLSPSGSGCFVSFSNGKGQGKFSAISGTPSPSFSTVNFNFYILDTNADGTANHILLISTDLGSATQPLLSGIFAKQQNGPYNTVSALDCALGTNIGCVFALAGATGGNSLTGNSYVLAGLASITTQSNTAGAISFLSDENSGGTVNTGTFTATYAYNPDGTGSFTPASGEATAFVLTDVDTGYVLSEGSKVSYGFFAPELSPHGPFTSGGLSTESYGAGTRFLGTAGASTTVGQATATQTGTNTGAFSGNTAFWNTSTQQNSSVLTGSYTTDLLTTRVTGTSNIPGATSFTIYQLNTNQFVLIGTTSGDTGAVLMIF